MSSLGIALIVTCLIADMAMPLSPGAFRLDPAESVHGVGPRTDTAFASHLSAPSVREHEESRAESSGSEAPRLVPVFARRSLRSVLPRAAVARAGVELCSSPASDDD